MIGGIRMGTEKIEKREQILKKKILIYSKVHDIDKIVKNAFQKGYLPYAEIITCMQEDEKENNIKLLDNDILLISDIKSDWNDFNSIKEIKEDYPGIHIIIYTDNIDYIYDGYEIGVFRYVDSTRENSVARIERAIYSFMNKYKGYNGTLRFEFKEGVINIKTDKIKYIEAINRELYFYLTDSKETLHLKGKITDIFDKIKEYGFFKVHRSYIVNYKHVKEIKKLRILLDSGDDIPISKNLYSETKRNITSYIDKKRISYYK